MASQGNRHCVNCVGATENARPENAGLENDGQLRKESQGLENAGLENDGRTMLINAYVFLLTFLTDDIQGGF